MEDKAIDKNIEDIQEIVAMSILASAACKMAKPNETEGLYISLAEFAWAETLSFDEQYLRAIYQQSKEIAQKMRENWSRDRT